MAALRTSVPTPRCMKGWKSDSGVSERTSSKVGRGASAGTSGGAAATGCAGAGSALLLVDAGTGWGAGGAASACLRRDQRLKKLSLMAQASPLRGPPLRLPSVLMLTGWPKRSVRR